MDYEYSLPYLQEPVTGHFMSQMTPVDTLFP
jgi:hypothetical protein